MKEKFCLRKGYTLLELLATMVVLSIIFMIATPIILDIIFKLRTETYKDDCYGLIESTKIYISNHTSGNKDLSSSYYTTFTCDGKECKNKDGETIDFKGEVPTGGQIIFEDERVTLNYIKYPNFCAYGTVDNLFVSSNCKDLDITEPIINNDKKFYVRTTETIIVNLLPEYAIDKESRIKTITVNIYDGTTLKETIVREINKKISSEESFKFAGLTPGKEYKIEIIVENGAEGIAKIEEMVSTGTVSMEITGSIVPTTAQNGYVKEENVNVIYGINNLDIIKYYIKSTSSAKLTSGTLVGNCGTGINPSTENCNNSSGTILSPNIWYEVSGSVSLKYNEKNSNQSTLYVTAYDGDKLESALTRVIHKIDRTSPTVTLGTVTKTSTSVVVPVTSSDTESGLGTPTCKYSTGTDTSYGTNATTVNGTTCAITGLSAGTTVNYQYCVADKVGNTATCKIGTTSSGTTSTVIAKKSCTNDNITSGVCSLYVATVTFNSNVTSGSFYIKSTSAATVASGKVNAVCGTSTDPGTCSSSSITTLAADTWYKVTGTLDVTYNQPAYTNATLYAVIYDGSSYIKPLTTHTIPRIFYNASQISYTTTSNSNVTTVEQALNDLYSQLN